MGTLIDKIQQTIKASEDNGHSVCRIILNADGENEVRAELSGKLYDGGEINQRTLFNLPVLVDPTFKTKFTLEFGPKYSHIS